MCVSTTPTEARGKCLRPWCGAKGGGDARSVQSSLLSGLILMTHSSEVVAVTSRLVSGCFAVSVLCGFPCCSLCVEEHVCPALHNARALCTSGSGGLMVEVMMGCSRDGVEG